MALGQVNRADQSTVAIDGLKSTALRCRTEDNVDHDLHLLVGGLQVLFDMKNAILDLPNVRFGVLFERGGAAHLEANADGVANVLESRFARDAMNLLGDFFSLPIELFETFTALLQGSCDFIRNARDVAVCLDGWEKTCSRIARRQELSQPLK